MYSSSQSCHTATGTHMPHGITQCYLPPDRADIPTLAPAEAGIRFSDLGGMQGWVDLLLVGCWHGYPSGARCKLAYGPADATATHRIFASVKSRLVLPFWHRLTRVVLDKGPLNRCVCVCVCNLTGRTNCNIFSHSSKRSNTDLLHHFCQY